MPNRIFINYRRGQSLQIAQHLATLLEGAFGKSRVFLDVQGIDGADNWLHTLDAQVDASDAMISLIGHDWSEARDEHGQRRLDNPKDFVVHEIARAWSRDIPVLPVLIDGAPMPDGRTLPHSLLVLTLLQAMPLRAESFRLDAEQIVKRLKVLLARRRRSGMPAWAASAATAIGVAGGVVAGPWLLSMAGLPFPGVTVTSIEARRVLEGQVTDLQRKVAAAEAEARTQSTTQVATAARLRLAEQDAAAAKAARDSAVAKVEAAEARQLKELAEQKAAGDAVLQRERQAAEQRGAAEREKAVADLTSINEQVETYRRQIAALDTQLQEERRARRQAEERSSVAAPQPKQSPTTVATASRPSAGHLGIIPDRDPVPPLPGAAALTSDRMFVELSGDGAPLPALFSSISGVSHEVLDSLNTVIRSLGNSSLRNPARYEYLAKACTQCGFIYLICSKQVAGLGGMKGRKIGRASSPNDNRYTNDYFRSLGASVSIGSRTLLSSQLESGAIDCFVSPLRPLTSTTKDPHAPPGSSELWRATPPDPHDAPGTKPSGIAPRIVPTR